MLGVGGTIYPVAQRTVSVPPVLVEIRDATGHVLYQWSVTPEPRTLAPGEIVQFSTELASPPTGAQSVHLSFATGNGGTASVSSEHGAEAGHGSASTGAAASGHGEAPASSHEQPVASDHADTPASSHAEPAAAGHADAAHEVSNDTSHSSEGLAGH